jgi:ABC-2 type transport system permease protein
MSKLVAGLTILPVLVFIAMLLTGIVAAVASFVAPLVLPVIGAPDLSGTAAAFGQISTLALVYLVLALLWYAPFFAWVGALSTVVGRWSIPLALLVPVVVSLFEGVVDFGSAPGGSYILTYLRQRMSFEFAGEDVERALAGNALGDIPGTAAKIIGGVNWLQLGIGLIFSLAVIYLASLYRRRVIKG